MKFLQHVVKFVRQILFGFFWNFSHVTMRGTLYINSITSQKMLASNSFSSIPKKCVENNVENMYIGGRIFRVKKLSVFKTLAPFQITHLVTNSHIKCLHVHLILLTLKVWLFILPSRCYTYLCKLVMRICCKIKIIHNF